MKEELSIDIIGLAGACSYALDCIEAELVNIKNKHGKRVAYISVCMADIGQFKVRRYKIWPCVLYCMTML